MPPKGWRKDGEQITSTKERDQISIEDILFPKATVNKLAKAILPDGGLVSKDSSVAIQRSATVFVNYLLVHARMNAKKFDRKTVGPQDVIAALEAAEFSSFIPAVRDELDQYQAHKDALKQKRREEKEKEKQETKQAEAKEGGNETVDEDSVATADIEEKETEAEEPQTEEPQTKKPRSGSREGTVSETEN